MRPVLGYGSSVWDPSSILQEELEKVQKRAAKFFLTGNYIYETGSMSGILEQLKWESLKKKRRDSRIIMLHKSLKGAASISTNGLVPPIRHVRNHHSLAFQTPFANTDIYKSSFFPQTIRDWNSLIDSLLSVAEKTQKTLLLSSLLLQGLGTNFPDHRSWWMIVIWSITSNNSNSDSDRKFWELCGIS